MKSNEECKIQRNAFGNSRPLLSWTISSNQG